MPRVSMSSSGSLANTEKFLTQMSKGRHLDVLDRYGREGVSALAAATPVDSNVTASSWNYKIKRSRGTASIEWTNSHKVDGTPLVILLQYGHGTGSGGYVQGRDFINPAIRPVFDRIAENVWKAVTSA